MTDDEKLVFMVSTDAEGNLVIMIGLTQQAFDYMKAGTTHNFDLNREGVPVKVIMFGGQESREEVLKPLYEFAKNSGVEVVDKSKTDFTIKDRRH